MLGQCATGTSTLGVGFSKVRESGFSFTINKLGLHESHDDIMLHWMAPLH